MPGAFGLETPQDLLAKLRRELERLRANPNDKDAAFNFFTTAEHMIDWLHPGSGNKRVREATRASEPLLQAVSHLASSSKHFDQLSKHHQSVKKSGSFGAFFGGSFFGGGFFGNGKLLIEFEGDAVNAFGKSKTAVEFAEMALAFWEEKCR